MDGWYYQYGARLETDIGSIWMEYRVPSVVGGCRGDVRSIQGNKCTRYDPYLDFGGLNLIHNRGLSYCRKGGGVGS